MSIGMTAWWAGLRARPLDAQRAGHAAGLRTQVFAYLASGVVLGVCTAGMWNVRAIDGVGVATFVTPLVGAFEGIATRFPEPGTGFGLRFAVAAGLAATATASSIATFTLLPALFLAARPSGTTGLRVPLGMTVVVATIGAVYGAFIGRMGPEGATAFNASAIRSAQSFVVFSALGTAMLVWAVVHVRLLRPSSPGAASALRELLADPTTKAVVAGVIAGCFTIGRPLGVFREFLLYAAQPKSAAYGAMVMALQSLATTAIPLGLLTMAIALAPRSIDGWMAANPRRAALTAAASVAAGGAFLIFYWGVTRVWPGLGRWGFELGVYQ